MLQSGQGEWYSLRGNSGLNNPFLSQRPQFQNRIKSCLSTPKLTKPEAVVGGGEGKRNTCRWSRDKLGVVERNPLAVKGRGSPNSQHRNS